ncbi:uncharacterized protein K452DRAFT_168017 [Aplosporella prunicola CBS 121167]|uniref:Uncharacterized protein n=1 Tax=Aplosporella prunicola CBS 121167 TaxID=1176127 RepID=A0A6A6BK81_9PEZI|nr:uncharacterized protein K452DRAFT_168017 [Aplosporella prunicola CBS 121167]KAF2143247.1 hypothetical protein K452DRAFT_168017 [Aplosporella prunicola CBS 121167]
MPNYYYVEGGCTQVATGLSASRLWPGQADTLDRVLRLHFQQPCDGIQQMGRRGRAGSRHRRRSVKTRIIFGRPAGLLHSVRFSSSAPNAPLLLRSPQTLCKVERPRRPNLDLGHCATSWFSGSQATSERSPHPPCTQQYTGLSADVDGALADRHGKPRRNRCRSSTTTALDASCVLDVTVRKADSDSWQSAGSGARVTMSKPEGAEEMT